MISIHKKVLHNMKYKVFSSLLFVSILQLLFTNCNNQKYAEEKVNEKKSSYKNLNVSILIDLSDRISSRKNPNQTERDLKFINGVLDAFKKYLNTKGVVQSKDKIKVIFYPSLNYDIYQSIADTLNIDFSKYEFKDRKKIYGTISSLYNDQLKKLYSLASNAKTYEGSDLFNYFKHRLVDDCISEDTNFINILIILTDGYIFHKNCKYQIGNRYSYLLPEANHIQYFRNLNNWEEVFDKDDYGLIKIDNDLSNISILIAELNPVEYSPKDFDIMKKYWSKWLKEQNIKEGNYKILRTDPTTLNRDIIFSFFNKVIERQ